jgi:hypothetical protein
VNARRRDEGKLSAHDRDQDVEPAELLGRAGHELVERAVLSHVCGEGDGAVSSRRLLSTSDRHRPPRPRFLPCQASA